MKSPTNLVVDPPFGWLYGFPALLEVDYRLQLKNAGYPEDKIEDAIKHSRYWPNVRYEQDEY